MWSKVLLRAVHISGVLIIIAITVRYFPQQTKTKDPSSLGSQNREPKGQSKASIKISSLCPRFVKNISISCSLLWDTSLWNGLWLGGTPCGRWMSVQYICDAETFIFIALIIEHLSQTSDLCVYWHSHSNTYFYLLIREKGKSNLQCCCEYLVSSSEMVLPLTSLLLT